MTDLTGLKAGDVGFVVKQRGGQGVETIEKTGREYGYVLGGRKFHLKNGQSAHAEGYVRANRGGFDVFRNQEDYERQVNEAEKMEELAELLRQMFQGYGYHLKPLPAEAVNDLLAVLNKHGLGHKGE
jgi:hypothetical protein